jgi:hypothetical protein
LPLQVPRASQEPVLLSTSTIAPSGGVLLPSAIALLKIQGWRLSTDRSRPVLSVI